MRLNGILLDKIGINKIYPIYTEFVSERKQKNFLRILKDGKYLNSYMIVEKDEKEDIYWLVSGFPEYLAYSKMNCESTISQNIPCVVRSYSNSTAQRITLLQKMFHHQFSCWLDKHNIISNLLEQDKSISYIARKLGVDDSVIESYLIHPDIPSEIIKLAEENKGSFINIETIRRLKLSNYILDKLYEKAVLKRRHPERLTTDKLQKIKWLLNREQFSDLNVSNQWILIKRAIRYKEVLEAKWDYEITELLADDEIGESLFKFHYNPENFGQRSDYQNFIT